MQVIYKRYGLYLLRGQARAPLAGAGILLTWMGQLVAAIVVHLIRGLFFFQAASSFLLHNLSLCDER